MTPPVTSIRTLLVANRGEIACRIARTCRRLGMATVAVFSDADADALHVGTCRRRGAAARVGAPADIYLRAELLVDAARRTGADAIHPGYGFLAENAAFAEAVLDAGLVWVGTTAGGDRRDGLQDRCQGDACAPPGCRCSTTSPSTTTRPTWRPPWQRSAIRCSSRRRPGAGDGACGSCTGPTPSPTRSTAPAARRRRRSATAPLFVERFVERGRHVEVQILGDAHGTVVALGRARVLDPAPSPEDHRGVAVASCRRCAAHPPDGRGDRRRSRRRLRGRRHGRVPARRTTARFASWR